MNNVERVLSRSSPKHLMTIFPHPDDETFAAAGLLLRVHKLGWKTTVVCLTQGESGQDFRRNKGKPLGKARRQELRRAAGILEVDETLMWDYPDGCLRESRERWSGRLVDYLRQERPGVVVTYGHSGITGHPDHIVVSVAVLSAVRETEPKRRPVLLWSCPLPRFKKRFKDSGTYDLICHPTHRVGMSGGEVLSKAKAFFAHDSQFGLKHQLMISLGHVLSREERFYKVDLRRRYEHRFVEYEI